MFGGFGSTAGQNTGGGAGGTTGFGGFGSTAATTQATGFGGFGATTSKAGGFAGFGASASQPAVSTGGFGGFGATTTGGFGSSAPATNTSTFGGFGAGGTTTSTGFGGFGAQPNTGQSSFGGFGTNTSQAPAASASAGFGGFGAGTTATSGTAFGGFGAATTKPGGFGSSFGGFGANTGAATTSTGFGGFGSFGSTTANKTGSFGGFGGTGGGLGFGGGFGGTNTGGGLGSANTFGFGQQQQQQNQPSQGNPVDELFNCVLHCSLFGDERDSIMARWNMLQASFGVGKAYYSNNAQPLTLLPENPFCKFKAIGYSFISKHEDKEGLVSLMLKKKSSEVESGKQALITSLGSLFGNRPNLKVNIEVVKSTGSETCEVVITIQETAANGTSRTVPASELNSFLNQQQQAQNLNNLGVTMVIPKVAISESDLKDYLANPPAGLDARLWKQAQQDNPDPKNLIPVPIIGFKGLQHRIKAQEAQSKAHQGRLDTIADEISQLQKKHQNTLSVLTEAKRKQLELSHRILKVLVKQESTRKLGFTITTEEEQLRSQLESLQSELAAPTQFKGRLNELLSQVRLQAQSGLVGGGERYTLDQYAVNDIKAVLKEQQEGIQTLVQMVKEDAKDMEIMMHELSTVEAR